YDHPSFLLVRCEDLLGGKLLELARIASFLGLEASERQLAQAVQRSCASRSQRRENIEPGHWKSALPDASVALIESAWGPMMNALGYELKTRDCAPLEPPFLAAMANFK